MKEFIMGLAKMPVGELISHIIIILGIISAFIEKSKKLPFNPWSKLFQWIGSKANAPILTRLDDIEKNNEDMRNEYRNSISSIRQNYNDRLDILERNADEKEAKQLRRNIIAFSDSCRTGDQHTKQHFENVFRDYDDYDAYCTKHKFENHFIEGEMTYIKQVYNECLKENKFL